MICKLSKIARKHYDRKYTQSDKGKATQYKYRHSDKGRVCQQRYCRTINGHLRRLYISIKERCTNPEHQSYNRYGGRGIKLKFVSSTDFVNYIINELQIDPRGLQIDRIDNNRHYEKGNIRFVTAKENSNNWRKQKTK